VEKAESEIGMASLRQALAALSTLLSMASHVAYADIAPRGTALAQQPVPRALYQEDPRTEWQAERPPLVDANVDVSLVAETVRVDLYPTLLVVQASFTLRALDKGERDLVVGFPERQAGLVSQPLDGLRVRVDGRDVLAAPEHKDVEHNDRFGVYWVWRMSLAPRTEAHLEVSYAQGLYAGAWTGSELALPATYVLRTGALWRGAIGRADLILRAHGLARQDVIVPPDATPSGEHEWRWSLVDFEPRADVTLGVHLARAAVEGMRVGEAPYSLAELPPRLQLIDRLVRFSRGATEPSADDWLGLVAVLRHESSASDAAHDVALRTRLDLFERVERQTGAGTEWLAGCKAWLAPATELTREAAPAEISGLALYEDSVFDASAGLAAVCERHAVVRRRLKVGLGFGATVLVAVLMIVASRRRARLESSRPTAPN